MIKWLLKHIKLVSSIVIAVILILLVVAFIRNEFNTVVGIVIVTLAALIAILTIMGRKAYAQNKTEKVLLAVKNELEYNLQILDHDQRILNEEIELIEDNKFSDSPKRNKLILEPLLSLKTGFWGIIVVDLFPDEIKKSELFVEIRNIDMFANKINKQIKSRESYKIANIEAHDISSTVKQYDRMILGNIEELRKSMMELGMQIYKMC